jgi:hypothetical protein
MDDEKKFIISELQIEEIHNFIRNHSTLSIMHLLKQLPLLEENKSKKEEEKIKNV